MKKKHLFRIILTVCVIVIGILLIGLLLNYTPLKMDIYVNGELVENTCAYRYDNTLYLPVMGIMEIYGYQTSYEDERKPTFIIDGKTYQLDIDNRKLTEGNNLYFANYVGGKIFIIKGDELYVLIEEMDDFFTDIGKEPVALARTDWKKGKVYIEFEE